MTSPHRSASIDALYRNGLTVWPGMTIGWIGDLTHQGEVSGHNPDDYAPLQAEQVDADNDPEVRALDFMIGPKFTATDAGDLVHVLTTGADRSRLYYVIYNRLIYKKSNNFKATVYTGTDPHTNHVHVSGLAADDANGSDWTSVLGLEDFMATIKQEDWDALIWRVEAIIHNRAVVAGGPKKGEKNDLHDALASVGGITGDDLAAVTNAAADGAKAGAIAGAQAGIAGATVNSVIASTLKPADI